LNRVRSDLNQYLSSNPETTFTLAGTLLDENGKALIGALVTVTGSHSASLLSDSQGKFRISNLPTSGSYRVAVSKPDTTFALPEQMIVNPPGDQNLVFNGTQNGQTISGRIVTATGAALPGITVSLGVGQSVTTVTTDANGLFAFPNLVEGKSYTVTPLSTEFLFAPASRTFDNLSSDQTGDFVGKPLPKILTVEGTDVALALESTMFLAQPFSISSELAMNPDGTTRVILFVNNLDVNDVSKVSASIEDEAGTIYPVTIENLATMPELGWLKQLNIKLPSNVPSRNALKFRISIAEGSSNTVRLMVAPDE
jgi:hypothetical protein